MTTHSIRLRGPWQVACFASPDLLPSLLEPRTAASPVALPCHCDTQFRSARFLRFFHCPTGLQPDDRVFVVALADGFVRSAAVDQTVVPVAAIGADQFEFDVTQMLRGRHLLSIDLVPTPGLLHGDPRSPGEMTLHSVRLEIRSASEKR